MTAEYPLFSIITTMTRGADGAGLLWVGGVVVDPAPAEDVGTATGLEGPPQEQSTIATTTALPRQRIALVTPLVNGARRSR